MAWVLHGDVRADDKVIAETAHRPFSLCRDEVTVSLYHLETYLVKFETKRTRDRARDVKKFNHEALEIHVRP